jgi:hypothetical protein
MKINIAILPAVGLLGTLLLPLAAQAQVPHPHPTTLKQRFQDQHARIHQGVTSGQLTRREAALDRTRLAHVRYQDERDRAHQYGHLTAAERLHQEHELNRNSKDIYHTKHNGHVR